MDLSSLYCEITDFLWTAVTANKEGIRLEEEIARRMTVDHATLLKLTDTKLFVEGGLPVAVNVKDQSKTIDHLPNTTISVEGAERLYKGELKSLGDIIARSSEYLSEEDTRLLVELDQFSKRSRALGNVNNGWRNALSGARSSR